MNMNDPNAALALLVNELGATSLVIRGNQALGLTASDRALHHQAAMSIKTALDDLHEARQKSSALERAIETLLEKTTPDGSSMECAMCGHLFERNSAIEHLDACEGRAGE
ncbi:MAG: hypothetical protein IT365_05170 [Candidatus Hydrogenedentes bacterium]|nr:hypothetical protein [Candidatus Hydrogenedentota bacterium]